MRNTASIVALTFAALFLAPNIETRSVSTWVNEDEDTRLVLELDDYSKSRFDDISANDPTPVVFWHGMGDTAFGSLTVDRLALQRRFPNISILSVQIGNNAFEDMMASYFTNVNNQIRTACKMIINNEVIKRHGAFNAVGFSQGGQFLRGLIQRCPFGNYGIKVRNFISLGGQHQGVFGLPNCFDDKVCNRVRILLTTAAYEKRVQDHVVQAEYWHDPYQEDVYKAKSAFLADINNEVIVNSSYVNNLQSLDHMVLVKFENDEMVIPRESSHFGFYAPSQVSQIIPLEESRLFSEDRLGLRSMMSNGKLVIISIPGKHLQYSMTWFINEIANKYLDN